MRKTALLITMVLLLGLIPAFPAESPSAGVVPLAPTSTFRVEVDGTEIRKARFYVGQSGLLILDCELKGPILVGKRDQTVRYVPLDNLILDNEGNVALRGAPSSPICSYQVSSGQIIFRAEGREIRLVPKKPLDGPQTLETIIEHSPDYGTRMEGYLPNQDALAYLTNYAKPIAFEIYFGSWCSICEAWIPRLVKSLQVAKNSRFQTRFYALPRNFSRKAIALEMDIKGVPTIILRQEGREIGRLQGRPERGSIEEAVVRLLRTAGG